MVETVSIDTVEPIPEDLIQLDSPGNAPLTVGLATERAKKAVVGLPELKKTYEEIYGHLISGNEEDFRKETASRIDYMNDVKKQEAILQLNRKLTSEGRPLDAQTVATLARPTTTDPDTVIEEYYAKKYVDQMRDKADDTTNFLNEARRKDPGFFERTSLISEGLIARNEFAKTVRDNITDSLKQQGIFGFVVDQAKMISQVYQEAKLRGLMDTKFFESLGLGGTLDAQRRKLYSMPLPEFKTTFSTIANKLADDNPSLALLWTNSMVGMSHDDVILNDIFSGAMATVTLTGAKIVKGAIKGTDEYIKVQKAYKDLVKSTDTTNPPEVAMAEGVGDAAKSAAEKTKMKIFGDLTGTSNPTQEATEALQAGFRNSAENLKAEIMGDVGRELANRMAEKTTAMGNRLMELVANVMRVSRTPGALAIDNVVNRVMESMKYEFKGHSVLEVSRPIHNTVTNTYSFDIAIGQPNATLFGKEETALAYAKNAQWGERGTNFTIEQHGSGHYIKFNRQFKETDDIVRDSLIENPSTKSPDSWLSAFAGWVRTPEETLSVEQRINRKVATYTPNIVMKMFKEEAKDIHALGKRAFWGTSKRANWKEWERTLRYAKEAIDPDTGERGYFFKNIKELTEFYQNSFKRPPNEAEVKGYFTYVNMIEADRVFRNIAVYRNKVRVGTQTHNFNFIDDEGIKQKSAEFDGVFQKVFPHGNDTILVVGYRQKESKLYTAGSMGDQEAKRLEKEFKQGTMQVVEIYDPELRPLSGFHNTGNARVRWVVAPVFESKGIKFDQIPRRGGGHFEYDYDFYVKQARVTPEVIGKSFKHWYEGDTTVMPVMLRAMGNDVAKHLNQVRVFLKDGNTAAAQGYVERNLPMEWKELHSWFKEGRDLEGNKTPPRLSMDEPFQVVERNKLIVDMDNELSNRYTRRTKDGVVQSTFHDGSRQGSLARQNQVQFTGERDVYDLFSVRDVGTRGRPLYEMVDAKFIDPLPSMQRALTRIVNSTFLDDYKIFSVEHWLREAAPYLKPLGQGDLETEIRRSPYWFFANGVNQLKGPAEKIQQLKVQHYQINQMFGLNTPVDNLLHAGAQKLYDSLYGRYGPKALILDPTWVLPKLKDPARFVRAATFHAKLGLFNIPQILVQLQTFTTIYGIAGYNHASSGTKAALLHQWARVNSNDEILDHLDNLASKQVLPGTSTFKPGEWKEAYLAMQKAGFGEIAGEVATRDDMMTTQIFRSGFKQFLDMGSMFLREGERAVRHGAWYTAYREFRAKNPTGRLTDTNLREILNRADLLSVNMSRASNSLLHTGIFSIPSQFLSYQLRTAELFLGKRLQDHEKARLLGYYATLYGVPTTIGLTGFPAGDMLRTYALENGYSVGEDYITSTLYEGVPALLMSMVSGRWYNVGDRWGIQGFETLREALRSDRTMWELMFGAAGSTLMGAWEQSDGLIAYLNSFINNTEFKYKVDDIIDPMKEISAVNSYSRLKTAWETSRWMSKKGVFLDETSPMNALFMTAMGLQETKVADVHLLSQSLKDQKEREKHVLKQFMQEFRRGLASVNDNSPNQANDYFKRAFVILDAYYPEEKKPEAIQQAIKDNESLVKRINWDFYWKSAPHDQKDKRREAYKNVLKQQGL